MKQSSVAFLVHASHKEAIEPSIFDLLYLISYFELFKQQKQLVPIFEDRCRAYGITNDRKKFNFSRESGRKHIYTGFC